MLLRCLLLLIAAISLAAPVHGEDKPCLTLAFYTEIPGGEPMANLLRQAYANTGRCVDVVDMPLARAGEMLLRGELDADMVRTKPFIDRAGDRIIAVPTPLFILEAVAITRRNDAYSPDKVADLTGQVVGYKIGARWAEVVLDEAGAERLAAYHFDQLFSMLKHGRLKVALVDSLSLYTIQSLGLFDDQNLKAGDAFVKFPMYHVLSAKNADLVPTLDAAIRTMQSDAQFTKTMQQWYRQELATKDTATPQP